MVDTSLISELRSQQNKSKLPFRLSPEILCANKTGELPGSEHDAAIFSKNERDVIVVVLLDQLEDNQEGIEFCSKIGEIVCNSFE